MLVLAAFALVAGSVVCLASGQPSVMVDCGNQMSEATICPFMSVALPTIATASLGKEVVLILTVVLAGIAVVRIIEADQRQDATLSRYWDSPDSPPISFLNFTVRLISQGVLHSRVFGL